MFESGMPAVHQFLELESSAGGGIGCRFGDPSVIYDDAVVQVVASRCTEVESGGRMVDAILTNTLLPAEFLTRMSDGRPVERVHIGAEDGEFEYRFAL